MQGYPRISQEKIIFFFVKLHFYLNTIYSTFHTSQSSQFTKMNNLELNDSEIKTIENMISLCNKHGNITVQVNGIGAKIISESKDETSVNIITLKY